MTIQRLHSGKHMSQAVIHGNSVYLSGQIANDPNIGIKEQTQQVLCRIDDLLEQAGTDKSKLLSAQVWLVETSHFSAFNQVWDNWICPDNPPARATVQASLMQPGYLVEIMVVAIIE
jgi:enamine deaminase RidA (YjgF/YER057c/UK114 family)